MVVERGRHGLDLRAGDLTQSRRSKREVAAVLRDPTEGRLSASDTSPAVKEECQRYWSKNPNSTNLRHVGPATDRSVSRRSAWLGFLFKGDMQCHQGSGSGVLAKYPMPFLRHAVR